MAKFQVNRINPRIAILEGAIGPNTTETWSTNYFEPLINMKVNREEVLNLIFKDIKHVKDMAFKYDISILNNTAVQVYLKIILIFVDFYSSSYLPYAHLLHKYSRSIILFDIF